MTIEETLSLDLSDALSAVDQLEQAIQSTADAARESLSNAFTSAAVDAQALGDLASEAISRGISEGAAAGLADLQASIQDLNPTVAVDVTVDSSGVDQLSTDLTQQTPEVTVTVDASQVQDAETQLDSLAEKVSGAADTVTVGVDSSEIEQAQADLQDLAASEQSAGDTVTINADTSQVEQASQEVEDLRTSAESPTEIVVGADDAEVVSATADLGDLSSAISDASEPVQVTVDAAGIDEATTSLGEMTAAEQTAENQVTVTVEDSDVQTAINALGDLSTAETEASSNDVTVSVDDSGVGDASSNLDSFSGSANKAGASGAAAEVGLGGLLGRMGELSPATIAAVGSTTALGFGLEEYTRLGALAAEGTSRLNVVYGDAADAVQKININGLNTSLKELTLSTGGSVGAVQVAVANIGALGKATGASSQDILEAGQNYGALANYIAATRPELGNAQDIATRLGRALQTGGRFALALGLPLNSAGEIAQAASQKFGVATDQLTSFQKQSAALDLVMNRLGPDFAKNLDAGLNTPIVQIRAVEAALSQTVATAGKPITLEFVKTIQDAQPLIESLVGSLGGIALGATKGLEGGLTALAVPLRLVSSLLSVIPAPVFAAAAAFALGAKGASLLATSAVALQAKIVALQGTIAEGGFSSALTGLFTTAGASVGQINNLSAASNGLRDSQATLRTALQETTDQEGLGAAALTALGASEEADQVLLQARINTLTATAAVEKAEADAQDGTALSALNLQKALVQLAIAQEAEKDAAADATAKQETLTEATAAAGATVEGQAAEVDAAVTSEAAALLALQQAEAESIAENLAWTASLGPLGIAIGIAAVAAVLLGTSSKSSGQDLASTKQNVDDATASVQKYGDSLKLTGTQAAGLNQNSARSAFTSSQTAVDLFLAELKKVGATDEFNKLKLSVADAVKGINDGGAAARSFREDLVKSGQVSIDTSQFNPDNAAVYTHQVAEAKKALQDYINTGKQIPADADIHVGNSARAYDSLAASTQKSNDQLKAAVVLELQANGAAGTTAIQTAAQSGLLGQLTTKQQAHADQLLRESDAAALAKSANIDLQASVETLGTGYGQLLIAADAANTAITQGGTPTFAGIEAARAIKDNADAYKALTDDQRSAIDATIQYADTARTAAQADDDLLTTTGELGADFDSLASSLSNAADKWNTLSGAEGKILSEERDLRTGVRDLAGDVASLGTNLDDQNASFDGASVTLDNYQSVLSTLPQATQDAINSIGQTTGAAGKSANEIAAVQQALADLHAQGQDPVVGLIDNTTKVTPTNLSEVEKALPPAIQQKIKLTVDDSSVTQSQSKAQIDAEKAAATQKAVLEATGSTRDKLNTQAADNAAKLASDVQSQFEAIRNLGVDQLKNIDVVHDPDAAKKIEDVKNQVKLYSQALDDQAVKLGLNQTQVDNLRSAEGLLNPQIDQNFAASGLDKIHDDLSALELILLSITGQVSSGDVAKALSLTDPLAQAAALQKIFQGLAPTAQAGVSAALGGDTSQIAAYGAAVQSAVKDAVAAGADPAAALQAVNEINQYNQTHPTQVDVTADTIAAVTKIDDASKDRIAKIKAEDPDDSVNRVGGLIDTAARDRTATLTVIANTKPAENQVAALDTSVQKSLSALFDPSVVSKGALGALGFGGTTPSEPKKKQEPTVTPEVDTKPAEKTLDDLSKEKRSTTVTTQADTKPADKEIQDLTQKKRTAKVDVTLSIDQAAVTAAAAQLQANIQIALRAVGIVAGSVTATTTTPGASRPPTSTVTGHSTGGTIPGHVTGYSGGSGEDLVKDAVRRHQEQGYTSDLQPGKYNAGDYAVVGEDDSAGEYVVSQRPDQRSANISTLGKAADSFGFSLIPAGQEGAAQAAPQILTASPSSDPELVSAISSLAEATKGGWGAPTINAELATPDPAESVDQIFGRLNEMRFLGN